MKHLRLMFLEKRGTFFPEVQGNVSRYIKKCSQDVLGWLKMLQKSGKTTVLITASRSDLTEMLMSYSIG